MECKDEFEKIEEELKIKESEKIAKYGIDIKKFGEKYTVEEAKKIREKREKRDDKIFNFLIIMQVIFVIGLLVAMILVYKFIGDKARRGLI